MRIKIGSFEIEIDEIYVPMILGTIIIIVALVSGYR